MRKNSNFQQPPPNQSLERQHPGVDVLLRDFVAVVGLGYGEKIASLRNVPQDQWRQIAMPGQFLQGLAVLVGELEQVCHGKDPWFLRALFERLIGHAREQKPVAREKWNRVADRLRDLVDLPMGAQARAFHARLLEGSPVEADGFAAFRIWLDPQGKRIPLSVSAVHRSILAPYTCRDSNGRSVHQEEGISVSRAYVQRVLKELGIKTLQAK